MGWFPVASPRCPRGHLLYGVHIDGNQYHTCQHKTQGRRCGQHLHIVRVMDHCIVIAVSLEEFEQARNTGKMGEELRADLQSLVEAAITVRDVA